jgi:hypothetical protein
MIGWVILALGLFFLAIFLVWLIFFVVSVTTKSTSTPIPTPAPSPIPVPPTPLPPQTEQLRVLNKTGADIWVVATCGPCGTPFPGLSDINIFVANNNYYDFAIPAEGLVGARIFAKMGCDSNGKNCLVGDSLPLYTGPTCPLVTGCTGPCLGGPCGSTPCNPPLNSLCEFTFGCIPQTLGQTLGQALRQSSCNINTATTSFDTSNVDGYTLPFTLTVTGDILGCSSGSSDHPGIDGSGLDLTQCPSSIDLSYDGIDRITMADGTSVNLTDVDLRYYSRGVLVGCYSPCEVLTSRYQLPANSSPALQYCCPTPPVSSAQCQAYPAANNLYTQAVNRMVPGGTYTFAYDDSNALQSCPAGSVRYLMTFYPLKNTA